MEILSLFSPKARGFNRFYSGDSKWKKKIMEYLYRDHDRNEHFISDSLTDADFFSWVNKKKSTVDIKSAVIREFDLTQDKLDNYESVIIEAFDDFNYKIINGRRLSQSYRISMVVFAEDQLFVADTSIALTSDDLNNLAKIKFHEAYYSDITGITLKEYPCTRYSLEWNTRYKEYAIEEDDFITSCNRITICVPGNDIDIATPDAPKLDEVMHNLKAALRRHKTGR